MFQPYIAKARTLNGFTFDFHIANETGKAWYDGSADQSMPERAWCLSKLRPGMTVLDCGAHHGMMSVIFAMAVGPQGRVIAYEALPENAKVIEANAALNGLHNITVRPVGIGNENVVLTFKANASNTFVAEDDGSEHIHRIQVVRVDDDLPDTKIDFAKIDVEGYDLYALRGMSKVLRQRPIIDLELHNFIFENKTETLSAIFDLLRPMEYSWELLGEIAEQPAKLGMALPLDRIAAFKNPHLMGVPL